MPEVFHPLPDFDDVAFQPAQPGDELLTAAAGGADPTALARAESRNYLLGPRTADPTQTFRSELKRLLS